MNSVRAGGVAAIVLHGLLATAAPALEGRVLLPDGSPAVDATVSVLGQPGSTRTGADGRFAWLPDPPLPFQVLVILPGGLYAAPVLVEAMPADGKPVPIHVRATLSETVTVGAGSTPFTEAPPAAGATILASRDLELRRPLTLIEGIESLPGVSRIDEGRTGVPSIRGLARGRTLILIDGARVTTERRAGPSATFLDPFFLEAIELSRGFGSVAWGSDAFGGIIHARTRRGAPGSPLAGQMLLTGGVGVPELSAAGALSRGIGNGSALVQGRYREADDYDTPLGEEPNSGFRDWGVQARFDHEWGPGRLLASAQIDRGRDTGKPSSDRATLTSYPIEDSDRYTLAYEGDPRAGLLRWGAQAFLGTYRLVTDRERLATATQARQLARADVDAQDYGLRLAAAGGVRGARVEGGIDLNGRRRLSALGSTLRYDAAGKLLRTDTEQSIEDALRKDVGAFLTLDGRALAWLTVSVGGRLDHVTTRNQGGEFGDVETSHDAASGFASATAGPFAGTTATAQIASGFRDPTLSDRYFRGVGGRGFVTGNPELEPERSLQYDLALRRAGRVRSALYLYRYRISDLVERYRAGADFEFRNRGRALIRGVELEAQAEVTGGIELEIGAQLLSGEALDDDTPLADIPPPGLTLSLRRAFGERFEAVVRGTLRAADEEPGPTEQPIDGWATLDATLVFRPSPRIEARLVARNLFDAAYLQTPDEAAAHAPGRSLSLTLRAGF
ncbi:MAG: TonB-dependent receptor [Vicinamibacteria bacterium]